MKTLWKKSKPLLSILLCLCMVLSMIPAMPLSLKASAASATYIASIGIAQDGSSGSTGINDCKNELSGHTIIDIDLNQNAGGDYVYMGYKTTTDPGKAITGIVFRMGGSPPDSITHNGYTFHLVGGSTESNTAKLGGYIDLNAKAGGDYIYMYVTRDSGYGAPLTAVTVNTSKSKSGYETGTNTSGSVMDLNQTVGGDYLYLHYKRYSATVTINYYYLNDAGEPVYKQVSGTVKNHLEEMKNKPDFPTQIQYDGKNLLFLGWREDPSIENQHPDVMVKPSATVATSGKTYYGAYVFGLWPGSILTFDANGGSGAPDRQVLNDTRPVTAGKGTILIEKMTFTIPGNTCKKDGTCKFLGWSTDKNAATATYQPGQTISVERNTTLYAIYASAHGGTISYRDNGDGTHTGTWSCCEQAVTENHTFIASKCVCGTRDHDCRYTNGFCFKGCYEPAQLVDGYYQITNGGNLFWFAEYINTVDRTASAKLTADIDLENRAWTPIGSTGEGSNNFRGHFDGQGHTVTGLYAEGGRSGLGFFGEVRLGTVENFTIYGEVKLIGRHDYVGGVIGSAPGANSDKPDHNGATIRNITSYVNVTLGEGAHGSNRVGGFMGYANHETLIENCAWYGTLDLGPYRAQDGVGGLVGKANDNSAVTIRNCGAYGTIKTSYQSGSYEDFDTIFIGGIVSNSVASAQTTIENTLWAGTIVNETNLGEKAHIAAFGTLNGIGSVTNCYARDNAPYLTTNGTHDSQITAVTDRQMASGEVAYKLGAAWGQNIDGEGDKDAYPVFSDAKVYQIINCKNEILYYSNTNEGIRHDLVCYHENPPSCGGDGLRFCFCQVCGVNYDEPIPATGQHTYIYDCDIHCAVCTRLTRPEAEHIYEYECSTNCKLCGELTRHEAEHEYDYDCDADCNHCGDVRTDSYHMYEYECSTNCKLCGEPTRPEAVHLRTDADCVDSPCAYCGVNIPASAEHAYSLECDRICYKCERESRPEAKHVSWHPCMDDWCKYGCGTEMPATTSHEWECYYEKAPTCCQNGIYLYQCIQCGYCYEEYPSATGEHTWSDATCTEPKTCSGCGTTEGDALGHSFENGNCTVCGAVCTHEGGIKENYVNKGADHTYTCSVCKGEVTESHSYENGFCIYCDSYQSATGSGTEADPYQIGNAGQLYWFAAVVNEGYGNVPQNLSACAELTDDITVNENVLTAEGTLNEGPFRPWNPIADNQSYTGTFDGKNQTVSGLHYGGNTEESISLGLFYKNGETGVIRNVNIQDTYFRAKEHQEHAVCVGGIVGRNEGLIQNCVTGGVIIQDDSPEDGPSGGIVGRNLGTVENCRNTAAVMGYQFVGGIVGENENGTILGCSNSGDVRTINDGGCGGVVGFNNGGTVASCSNTGNATGSILVGGIAGANMGIVKNCRNTGEVIGDCYIGGLVGANAGSLANSFSTGTVTCSGTEIDGLSGLFGGVAGANEVEGMKGEISNCYYLADGENAPGGMGILIIDDYENLIFHIERRDVEGQAEARTAARFASGEVAYLLQGEQTEQVWGQNLDSQNWPVLGGAKVYYGYVDCKATEMIYANTPLMETMAAHSFENGNCTVCGEPDPDYVPTVSQPSIKLYYPTLSFKDEVLLNVYFDVSNMENVVEMGLLCYDTQTDCWTVSNAKQVISGYERNQSTGLYKVSTKGIPAKNMGDTVWFSVYAKLSDGSYCYSKLADYSPERYAYSQLGVYGAELDALLVAMLNYGAAAQLYFNYNTDDLINKDLTAEQQALAETYRKDMMPQIEKVEAAKQGSFVDNGGFTGKNLSVSFKGAFMINYYCTPVSQPVDGITMYYWKQADFLAADVLTAQNATGAVEMTLTDNGVYKTSVTGISAKNMADGVYVAFVYSDGPTTYSSNVLQYSVGSYCNAMANDPAVAQLAQATAVYGYSAKQYFAA